jgi:hypothetical protein
VADVLERIDMSTAERLSWDEFKAIATQLVDEFERLAGTNVPALSDHAVSRAGIYEDHP